MRSELEQLEQIDQYLGGKMSPDQISAFEAQMNADPALKSMVQDQQLLIQTVARKAMMAQINTVAGLAAGAGAGAGAAAGGWSAVQWVITGISILGATVGGIFIYDAVTDDSDPVQNETELLATTDADEEATFDSTGFDFVMLEGDEKEDDIVDDEGNEVSDIKQDEESDQDTETSENSGERDDPLNDFSNLDKPDNNGYQHTAEYEETETTSNIQKNRIAQFPGGRLAMEKWFAKNLHYPGTAKKNKVQGTVRIKFFVTRTGEIDIIDSECFSLKDENGKILEGIKRTKHRKSAKLFENQAERAFRICPSWIPATNMNGSSTISEQVWYVNFVLNGKSEVYTFGNDSGSLNEDEENEIDEEEDVYFEIHTAEDAFIEPTNK